MKIFFNRYGYWLCLALIAGAVWICSSKVGEYHRRAAKLERTISSLNQEIRRAEVRLNDSVTLCRAEVESLSMTYDNLKDRYNGLLRAADTRPKDVRSLTGVASTVHEVETVFAVADTFGGLKASVCDSFATVSVEVFPDRKTIIDYSVRDSLTVISVQKRHSWLFGLIKWSEPKG